jgi:hypothetical protein
MARNAVFPLPLAELLRRDLGLLDDRSSQIDLELEERATPAKTGARS